MGKKSSVAKGNEEEARKCGTRWKNVIPWHADADEATDDDKVDSFAAAHSDIADPGEGLIQACPCSAPSDTCSICAFDTDIAAESDVDLEEPVVIDLRKRFAVDLAASCREAKSDVRLSAPRFRGRRGILAA